MISRAILTLASIVREQYVPLRMHPLFHGMCALMLGIVAGRTCFPWPYTIKIMAVAMLVCITCLAVWQAYRHNNPAVSILSLYVGCAFILGCIRMHQRIAHFYSLGAYAKPTVNLEGTIIEHAAVEHPLIKDSITLRVERIMYEHVHSVEDMVIKIYCARRAYVSVADRIRIENIAIKQPCKDEFTWYLIKEGITSTAFLPSYKGTLIERPEYSLRRWIDETRTTLLKGVCSCLDRSTQALYASLFLGNRSAKKDELDKVADEFRAWGISHYLARSGLHMVIFASLWSVLLNMLPLANIIKILLLCIITALYATLSWSSISFIRALSAFVAYKLYSLLRIPAHSIHVFSLVCYFVLLDNPTQLFFLDFQLSFGLTFGIAWFYHTYGAYLRRLKSMQYTRTVE